MQVPLIYEDNHLLIVEKPVNVPVQEDNSHDADLLNWLKADIKRRYNKPGNVYLGLVHRLDRPVGGVMVFAKTSKAAGRLANALRKREIERTYLAVVHGRLAHIKEELIHYLWKDRRKNQVYSVDPGHPDAKKAILSYERLAVAGDLSLVKIQLQTGRSHQIRVQFQAIGHPLYGDQKYAASITPPHRQIALWAYQLALPHPTTKERLTFESLPPAGQEPWKWFELGEEGYG